MSDLVTRKQAEIVSYEALPPDVDAMRNRLRDVKTDVGEFRRVSDGLLLGVGLDGLIGLIPVVGGAYSIYGGVWLLMQAFKAKCSLGTKMSGIALVLADVIIGAFIGAGDVVDLLFRSHAWFAGMILSEVDAKLAYAERMERELALSIAEEREAKLRRVRDHLFRGGKSERAIYLRMALIIGVCLFFVHECRRAEEARQETIRTCVTNGGWFCSYRH